MESVLRFVKNVEYVEIARKKWLYILLNERLVILHKI